MNGSPQFEALFVDSFSGQTGDVIAELRLPRETLVLGGKIPLAFTRHVPCETCKGTSTAAEPSCKECTLGYSKVEASVEVEIPAGSAPGMQVRVPGQGHIRPDKPQGDVIVVLAAGLQEESSPAAQKLPLVIVFTLVTVVVLILAIMMARQG